MLVGGRLSTHISKLIKEGYIESRKGFTMYGPRTFINVTDKGIKAYYEYVNILDKILRFLEKE
ncbi:MAG: hypothetical protein DRH24_15210 [Deltaproteobacteria bacterium]|nr:MAG: hypothetical protein DRH24_15210 [Deltaproteobacteria bacterium]